MGTNVTAAEIKRIRGKYGLTQKAFAQLLGIGSASMVRYESGQVPSKANSNLIRAADNPSFMLDCLERDGDVLPEKQLQKTEKIVYSLITLDEEGAVMDINEIYEITLQQEILNEQAAEYLGDLSRLLMNADELDDYHRMIYEDAAHQIARIKATIIDEKNCNKLALAQIRGKIEGIMGCARRAEKRAA